MHYVHVQPEYADIAYYAYYETNSMACVYNSLCSAVIHRTILPAEGAQ